MTTQLADEVELSDIGGVGLTYLPVPNEHPSISPSADAVESIYRSTACWSGHTALWKLEGEKLYLTGLRGLIRLNSPTSIPADWVTGTYFINFGKHIDWYLEDLLTERCLAIHLESGRVLRSALWRDDESGTSASYLSREKFQSAFKGELNTTDNDPWSSQTLTSQETCASNPFAAQLPKGDA